MCGRPARQPKGVLVSRSHPVVPTSAGADGVSQELLQDALWVYIAAARDARPAIGADVRQEESWLDQTGVRAALGARLRRANDASASRRT